MFWKFTILLPLTLISLAVAVPDFKKDASTKISWKFKDHPKLDVSKVILEWEPFTMLEDTTGVDSKGGLGVNIKSGDGDYKPFTAVPRIRGGKYIYTIDIVPCMQHVIQVYAKNKDGITFFDDFDNVIPVSAAEAIADSSFILPPPANPRIEADKSGDQYVVYWDESTCATSYLVTFNGGAEPLTREVSETKLVEAELEKCSEYEVSISAMLGAEHYSEEVFLDDLIKTLPSIEDGDKIEPVVNVTKDSLHLSWDGFTALSCIPTYSVTLCNVDTSQCQPEVQVKLDNFRSIVNYSAERLEMCSQYSVRIQPEYPDMKMVEKVVEFRTLAPGVDDVVSQLGSVTAAVSGDDQHVSVSWSRVTCADQYHVYHKLVSDHSEWEYVSSSTDLNITVSGVPCTQYHYGVKAVIDGVESDVVEAPDAVMTPLDGDAFSPPNLVTRATPDSLTFTWDHATCVSSYIVQLCSVSQPDDCLDQTIQGADMTHVEVTFNDLVQCSGYSLQISASTGERSLSAETVTVSTSAPEPTAPENFSVKFDDKTNKIQLSYDPQVCASGYNIYQVLDQTEPSLIRQTTDIIVSLDSPPPCSDFSYAVSAVMDGDVEGPKTEFLGDKTPPNFSRTSRPSLGISEKFNKTVILSLSSSDVNTKCEVETYNIKFLNLEDKSGKQELNFVPSQLKQGQIVLDFPQIVDKGVIIEGRIKYVGFDSWSPWVSSRSQKPEILLEEGNGIIVPIVIGAMIAIVVLVVLIFFIVRRKKSQNKYNCDKSDQSEEQKKLNEEA